MRTTVLLAALLALPVWGQTRIISHVTAPGGGFTTTVHIENQSVVAKDIVLTPYDNAGNALTEYRGTVQPRGTLRATAGELFGDGVAVSHFLVSGEESLAVSVDYNFQSGNGSPARVNESRQTSDRWRIFPGDWDLVFDGLAAVNRGDAPAAITITQKGYDGSTLREETIVEGLVPNGKTLYVMGSPNGSSFDPPAGSYFELTADQPIALTALRGTLGNPDLNLLWGNELLDLNTVTGLSAKALDGMPIVSHVTAAGGGFTTTVILENHTDVEQAVTVRPFNATGSLLLPFVGNLPAGGVLEMDAADMLTDQASHFQLDAAAGVLASVNYDFQAGAGSPAHVRATLDEAAIWRIFPGDWNLVFDGLAIVNTGSVATDIWIVQKDFNDNHLRTERISAGLTPNAKTLFVIGSPNGSTFADDVPSYFELSASQPLALTALRGTLGTTDVGLLWANEDTPVSLSKTDRDEKGVWFIRGGQTLYEVFEAMGYNVAVDRLYQTETYKRRSRGRFAELWGPAVVAVDRLWRNIMYSNEELDAIYETLDEESKTLYKAYIDGLNRRIEQVNALEDQSRPDYDSANSLLPIEYRFFQLTSVEPWTLRDILANTSAVQLNFTIGVDLGIETIENAAILQDLTEQFGAEQAGVMFNDLRWNNDPTAPVMIPGGAAKVPVTKAPPIPRLREGLPDLRPVASALREQFDQLDATLKQYGAHQKMGSYAWAVSGDKTNTGNPMIYAGPQMSFVAPAIIVEGSIESDVLNVQGMHIPGVPAIILGRTPHHAWSFQVGHAASWDYYLENDEDIFVDRTEIIQQNNAGDLEITVRKSDHGVILEGTNLALKYAHWFRDLDLTGILKIMRAESMEEFGEGVAAVGLSQHILYADRDGNIAYWMSGRTPVRADGDYRFPQGTVGDHLEWDRDVTEPIPHDANPARGWYGGWNNKSDVNHQDVKGAFTFGPFHRTHVIEEYLTANDNLTYEQVRDLAVRIAHTDAFPTVANNLSYGGNPWPFVRDVFIAAVNGDTNADRQSAVDLLEAWDGYFAPGGEENWLQTNDRADAWMLLDRWLNQVLSMTFDDELGDRNLALDRFNVLLHAINPDSSIQKSNDWFFNHADPLAPQTRDTIIVAALDNALAELGAQPWGVDQRGVLVHQIFFPINIPATPFSNRSTYAQCLEYDSTGPIRIETIFPLGQSGTAFTNTVTGQPIFTDHNFDLVDLFNNFTLRPFWLFGQEQ